MEKIDRLTSKFAGQEMCELCAVEELAELITAIQHKCRNRPVNLAEEIAHATLMVEAVRKKYAIPTQEIMLYEKDMVDRYLTDKEWNGEHVPSKVRYRLCYNHNGTEYEVTFDNYEDAIQKAISFNSNSNYRSVSLFME